MHLACQYSIDDCKNVSNWIANTPITQNCQIDSINLFSMTLYWAHYLGTVKVKGGVYDVVKPLFGLILDLFYTYFKTILRLFCAYFSPIFCLFCLSFCAFMGFFVPFLCLFYAYFMKTFLEFFGVVLGFLKLFWIVLGLFWN